MAKQTPPAGRTETVTIRLDARYRYLAELGARATHRSVSSFFEWCLIRGLDQIPLTNKGDVTIASAADKLWHSQAADRAAALAWYCPSLLTVEEREIWDMAVDRPSLFAPDAARVYRNLNAEAFRRFYETAMTYGIDYAVVGQKGEEI
ncbi:hypothetical protein [Cupriavidus campinensis]